MSEPRTPPVTDHAAVFARVAAGIFIASPEGRYLDANPYGLTMLGYTRDELLTMSLADVLVPEEPDHVPPRLDQMKAGGPVIAERQLRCKDGSVLWAEIAGQLIPDGTLLGVVTDVSARKRAEARLEQLARLYAFTSQVNAAVVRTTDPTSLFDAICRVAVAHGGLRMAWCGIIDDATGDVPPVARAGHVDGYLDGLDLNVRSGAGAAGMVGTALRDGRVTISAEIEHDPMMAPWRARALARGYRSSAAVPLRRGGKVVAVLSLYAATRSFFSEEERALLVEIADDVSFALGLFEAERRRHDAEQALRASEARMEHVLAASPATIYTLAIEPDGVRTTWVSENVRTLLGYQPAELLTSQPWWQERVHPDDRPRVLAAQAALAEDGRLVHEYRLRARDGRYVWLLDQLVLLRGDDGAPREVIGAWTDITRRREAEEHRLTLERQLLHAQKLESLGVLAGGIAHDFNNLLMALIGHLELASLELPAGAPARANVEQAARAAHRAAHLTRQMLAYSGRGRFVIDVLDLAALVAEHAGLMRASIPRRVTLDVAGEPVAPIEADAGQVQQVVMNLIANAADAIGNQPGRITVRIHEQDVDAVALAASRVDPPPAPGRFVVLDVSDDGCGMDDETRARLFEPFFTTKAQGRGLGMAAILGIVRSHHGAIFVDSQVGAGSRFRVLFPVAPAQAVAAAAVTARPMTPLKPAPVLSRPAVTAMPRRVMFVDDEERLRRVGARLLRHLGIEAIVAADGVEAVELFDRRCDDIDLIILDLSMPRMDGFAALAELRRRRPDVPVLLSSGYDEREASRRIPGDPATWSLQKPYSLDALRAKLAEIWAQRTRPA
jgi:PAS domain S-box-containing protein